MFEGIQRGLSEALKRLRGRGRISESNVREAMNEVRTALIEADVNYDVANAFIQRVTQKSIGTEVIRSLDPSEQIIRIVYDELVQLMGPVDHKIAFAKNRPTVIMLCGLQGSGKTTTAGKLALYLRDKGRKPLLVAADLQRPAAIDQLHVLGGQLNVPVYSERPPVNADGSVGKTPSPIDVCRNAVNHASKGMLDTVILDTAGRLHVAEMPMDELKQIDRVCRPDEVFFVCDAMTGQDAVNSARAFHEALTLNGVIMTKLDGDARGGAALSVKEVTGVPIKFIGVGEKLEKLEEFHPERLAQRILGQGDLMSVIEKVAKVQQQVSQEELLAQQKKMEKGDFNLDDFRTQLERLKTMGSMKDLLGAMPGMSEALQDADDPEEAMARFQGIIDSMTKEERRNPDMIDASRRRRIGRGSGTEPHEINAILKQFDTMRTMMRQIASMSMFERIKYVTGLGKAGAFAPGAQIQKTKIGTGHRKSPKERAKERKKKGKRKK
jgi:signal recognition particle subunit SRP54